MSKNSFSFSLGSNPSSLSVSKGFSSKMSAASSCTQTRNKLSSNLSKIFAEEEEDGYSKIDTPKCFTGKKEEKQSGPDTSLSFNKVQLNAGRDKTKEKQMLNYMEKDSSVFLYDEVYDDINDKKKEKKNYNTFNKYTYLGFTSNKEGEGIEKLQQNECRGDACTGIQIEKKELAEQKVAKSKYVSKLMASSQRRALEREIIQEKILQKERDQDIAKYGEKEVFLTSAYKQKLAFRKKVEEEFNRQEQQDIQNDVTKKKNFADFHKNLLLGGLASRSNLIHQNESLQRTEKNEESEKQNEKKNNESIYGQRIEISSSVAIDHFNNNKQEKRGEEQRIKYEDNTKGRSHLDLFGISDDKEKVTNYKENNNKYSEDKSAVDVLLCSEKTSDEKASVVMDEKVLTKEEKEMCARLRFLSRKKQKLNGDISTS